MRQLVLHHRYSLGVAWDTSGFQNHGVAHAVTPHQGSMRFTQLSSRIDVPPSGTLADLGAFRCSCTFRLEEADPVRRYNLVELQLSFALFIDPPLGLRTTILDGNSQWSGVGVLGLPLGDGNWHRADCGHDGLSTSWLAFDGHVVAERDDVPGPVRPVGPNGLTIGHWPEPVDNYAFHGTISEVWLWRDRPDPPFDDCCVDRTALARAGSALRRLGLDLAALRALKLDLQRTAALLYTQLPTTARDNVSRTAPRMLSAFRVGRYELFASYARHLYDVLVAAVGQPAVDAATGETNALLAALASDAELLQTLPGFLCNVAPRPPRPKRAGRGDPYASNPAVGEYPGYRPALRPRLAPRDGDGRGSAAMSQ